MKDHVNRNLTAVALFGAIFGALLLSPSAHAQTLTTLYNFCGHAPRCPNGNEPSGSLIQALDGDLYGTTFAGGAFNGGTIFKVTPSGAVSVFYSFCAQKGCPDGETPSGALVQSRSGELYGTTEAGGGNFAGTFYKITQSGAYTTLHSFCFQDDCADGVYPSGGLIQSANGDIYGTNSWGGINVEPNQGGVFYKITPAGMLTTVYTFCVGGIPTVCPDGEAVEGGVIQGTDGNFYGTTSEGGAYTYSGGTVFNLTPGGTLTTLYTFSQENDSVGGVYPESPLVLATNGDLYGTTSQGGSYDGGTIFKITPSGTFITLYNFSLASGYNAGLYLLATDGNLYGTTGNGGLYGGGTLFKLTPSGELTILYNFCAKNGCTDGAGPSGLVQATDGNLYGTTTKGGIYGQFGHFYLGGTLFRLSIGAPPFVKTMPTTAAVGAAVTLTGTNLTGATRVTFNGTAAAFSVASATAIKTTVPTGAATGTVQVTTPWGTLSSNIAFRVSK